MTLEQVKDYLKSQIECDNWYIGKVDANKEYCIGVYPTESPTPITAIGGLANAGYGLKAISILVHWGKSVTLAERKAKEVFDVLFCSEAVIGKHRVFLFDMRTAEPVGIGTDEKGIYEYVINFVIYYNLEEE